MKSEPVYIIGRFAPFKLEINFMQSIRPTINNFRQVLGTSMVSGSKSGKLESLLGLTGSQAPDSARYLSTDARKNLGFMNRPNATPMASMKHVSSVTSAMAEGIGQKRQKFTMVNYEQFEQLKKDKPLEFVGLHGTARFAAEAMESGFDPEKTGKYTGGRSRGGKGIYTANSNEATSAEQAIDGLKTAEHYARRASLGEPLAFDLDTSRVILAFYRVSKESLNTREMPAEVQGKAEQIAAFREQHPADEYTLGATPLPRRLKDVNASTILITDKALESEEAEYYAVEFKPKTQET
jgi:hypothetical protein